MIKIKTPVRYDDSQLAVIDADGEILCQLDLWLDEIEMDGERVGDQIADALNRTADFEAENEAAKELAERLKGEAEIHAQEARTANSTINEIYQVCSNATGEKGNWNGAQPVREMKADLEAKLATAKEGVTKAIHQLLHPGTDAYSGEHYVSWAIGHLEEVLATISGDTKGDDDGK